MKFITSLFFSLTFLLSFSQQKNCNTINIGRKICEFDIWKENADTIFCVVKPNNSTWDKDRECGYYHYEQSKNKTWIFYSQDTLIMFEKFTIKDSLLNGENLKYYLNGSIKEKAFYINGKLEGQNISYYNNHKIENYSEYKNGEINGPYITYYTNGFIETTSNYCDGHYVKVEYKYWDNDRLASVNFYSENLSYFIENPINMYFDPNGISISEMEFKEMWYCKWGK
jgi:antitoxin component YwqK of YwqJK toxin-antitoxin module